MASQFPVTDLGTANQDINQSIDIVNNQDIINNVSLDDLNSEVLIVSTSKDVS